MASTFRLRLTLAVMGAAADGVVRVACAAGYGELVSDATRTAFVMG